jgi:histidine ammonia-lyase
MMIHQVVAASLVSQNKVLSHPASTDSIPTSANREDHVSMGAGAVLKLRALLDNVAHVLAIELLCACQALEFVLPLKPGRGVEATYALVRSRVPALAADRSMCQEIELLRELIEDGELRRNVEKAVGKLA